MVLSDPELEWQVADRISFMKFLGFPETENALIGQVKMRKSAVSYTHLTLPTNREV